MYKYFFFVVVALATCPCAGDVSTPHATLRKLSTRQDRGFVQTAAGSPLSREGGLKRKRDVIYIKTGFARKYCCGVTGG